MLWIALPAGAIVAVSLWFMYRFPGEKGCAMCTVCAAHRSAGACLANPTRAEQHLARHHRLNLSDTLAALCGARPGGDRCGYLPESSGGTPGASCRCRMKSATSRYSAGVKPGAGVRFAAGAGDAGELDSAQHADQTQPRRLKGTESVEVNSVDKLTALPLHIGDSLKVSGTGMCSVPQLPEQPQLRVHAVRLLGDLLEQRCAAAAAAVRHHR